MRWTKEEEQFLRDNYGKYGPAYCAKTLNRAYKAVTVKASKLDLTKSLTKYRWSKQEDKFLIQNYSEYGADYCAENLDRSYESVLNRAWQLKLTKASWSEQEEHFLIDNYANSGPTYCAEKLNRTYGAIVAKAIRLNLQANTKYDSNIVYSVYFPDLFLYKVGITNNVERRIKQFGHPCIILKIQECEPTEAAQLERKLLKSVTLINTGALNSGNTETFMQPSKEIKEFLGKQFA